MEFREKFIADYEQRIIDDYGEEPARLFVHLIYKDIFDLNKVINKCAYNTFMGQNTKANPHYFYERLENYAIGNMAMREVLDMDSSVRLTAIQNLGKDLELVKLQVVILVHYRVAFLASS